MITKTNIWGKSQNYTTSKTCTSDETRNYPGVRPPHKEVPLSPLRSLQRAEPFPTLSSSSDHKDQARFSYSSRCRLQTSRGTPQWLSALRAMPCRLGA